MKLNLIISDNENQTTQNKLPSSKSKTNRNGFHSVTLLGAADDTGVRNVGGRTGSAQGPAVFRKTFGNLGAGYKANWDKLKIFRGIDIEPRSTIDETHFALRQNIINCLKNRSTPIVIGGGHDFGYPQIAAATDYFGLNNVALINIDAHFDVRPVENGVITSGSPFYLALENKSLLAKNFVEFGIQEHCNLPILKNYIDKKHVKVLTIDDLRKKGSRPIDHFNKLLRLFSKKKIVVSIDLDAFAMGFAPGVSAPQADGLLPSDLMEICSACGKNKSVVSLGFFELAPNLDVNNMTATLAATALHRYLSSL